MDRLTVEEVEHALTLPMSEDYPRLRDAYKQLADTMRENKRLRRMLEYVETSEFTDVHTQKMIRQALSNKESADNE